MREVKYKAWFAKVKRMAQVDSLNFIGNGHAEVIAKTDFEKGGWYTPLRECTNRKTVVDGLKEQVPRVILREYTGLKDKNGVEIYEGDILQFEHAIGWSNEYQCVIADKWGWGTDEYAFWEIADRKYLFKVIGNIYEQPELLGDSN